MGNRMRWFAPVVALVMLAVVGGAIARLGEDRVRRVQASGDAEFGVAYALGSEGHELGIAVESARLLLRYPAAEDELLAEAGERLLVLRVSVRNPLKKVQRFHAAGLRVGWATAPPADAEPLPAAAGVPAVGANAAPAGQDGVADAPAVLDPETGGPISVERAPFESLSADVVVPIAAAGAVRSVWLARGPVTARYDTSARVTKLVDVFADRDGLSARDAAEVRFGQVFAMGAFDWRIDRLRRVRAAERPEDEDETTWVADVSVRNAMRRELPFGWHQLTARLTDPLETELRWEPNLEDERGETVDADLPSGGATAFRLVFQGDPEQEPVVLALEDDRTKRTAVVRLKPKR